MSEIPKYKVILDEIVAMILNRELPPHSRIPSENEIISTYHVSNTTARKVLQELVSEGLAEKVRGKGTFVKDFFVGRSANKVLSFTKNMLEQGLQPGTKVLESRSVNEGIQIGIAGKVYQMSGPVLQLKRLRLANNVPMMMETRHISLNYCPGIWHKDLGGSLYNIYRDDYKLTITRIEQDLSAVELDVFSRDLLLTGSKSVGIRIQGVTFCGRNMILETEESIYRGDAYRFSVVATP